jgi:hypothetical protein
LDSLELQVGLHLCFWRSLYKLTRRMKRDEYTPALWNSELRNNVVRRSVSGTLETTHVCGEHSRIPVRYEFWSDLVQRGILWVAEKAAQKCQKGPDGSRIQG